MGTQLHSLTDIAERVGLQMLYCGRTQVSDLSALAGLPALQMLYCVDPGHPPVPPGGSARAANAELLRHPS